MKYNNNYTIINEGKFYLIVCSSCGKNPFIIEVNLTLKGYSLATMMKRISCLLLIPVPQLYWEVFNNHNKDKYYA